MSMRRDSNFVSLQGSERVILLIGIMHPLLEYLSRKNKNTNGVYEEDASPIEENLATSSILPTLPAVCITRVTTVHNNYLHGMYELKKLEYESRYGSVQEVTLVHSTSALKVPSIIKNNLDWRRVTRNKYGKGVSFSNDADYANFHSNRCNGEKRAFIVAKVLVSRKDYGYDFVVIPLPNVDTSISSSENVYVKYSDNEFLIKYIVYYNAPDRTKSIMHPVLEYLSNVNNNYNREYEEDLYDESIATSSILSTFPGVCITRVTTVHNNYLHGIYELKKLEYESRYGSVQELTLVHSTSARNVPSIIEDNLDWRRVVRGKYGDGVSFSGDAGYANRFSNRCNGYERAFIVATVLVSREMELDGYTSMEVPPDDVDTTTGNDGQVYVKYCDNEFLIKYIVYYRYQL